MKYDDILNLFKYTKIQNATSVILIICLFAVIAAIFFAFKATKPCLKSGNEAGEYTSLLFFNSVATMKQEIYSKKVFEIKDKSLKNDIIRQTHTLALSLKNKFSNISLSKNITLWGVLLSIEISTLLLIADYIARELKL